MQFVQFHSAVQLKSLIMKSRVNSYGDMHTLPENFFFLFFCLSLNILTCLTFSPSLNGAKLFTLLSTFRSPFPLRLSHWVSLVLVYGSLIFNATCNRMTFSSRLIEISVNLTMTLNEKLGTWRQRLFIDLATAMHAIEIDEKKSVYRCSTFIGS